MSQQSIELKIRPVAIEHSGERGTEPAIRVKAGPDDTILDIERALIEEFVLPPPPDVDCYKWLVVTADGEEVPVSREVTVGELVERYSARELKVLFHCGIE